MIFDFITSIKLLIKLSRILIGILNKKFSTFIMTFIHFYPGKFSKNQLPFYFLGFEGLSLEVKKNEFFSFISKRMPYLGRKNYKTFQWIK
jgi:hypothetical protein